MDTQKTIIVMGINNVSELNMKIRQALLNKYGNDLIILVESEAKEKGIMNGSIPSISPYKSMAPPIFKSHPVLTDPYEEKNNCKKGWKK